MANPLYNEKEIYERIQKEKVTIDPDVAELLSHHIRNDLNAIFCGLGQYEFLPPHIIEEADKLIAKLYKEAGEPGDPPPSLAEVHRVTMRRCRDITQFLEKILKVTTHERGGDA